MFFSAFLKTLIVLFRIVIVNFDCKNYAAAGAGDSIGDEHWPYDAAGVQHAL